MYAAPVRIRIGWIKTGFTAAYAKLPDDALALWQALARAPATEAVHASPAAARLAEALARGARPHLPDDSATAHALGRSVLAPIPL